MPYAVQPMLRSDGGAFWCDYDLYAHVLERIGGIAAAGLSSVGVYAPGPNFVSNPCHPAAPHLYDPEKALNSLNAVHPHSPLDGLPDELLANLLCGPHYGSPHATPESSVPFSVAQIYGPAFGVEAIPDEPEDAEPDAEEFTPTKILEQQEVKIDYARYPFEKMEELVREGLAQAFSFADGSRFVLITDVVGERVMTFVFHLYQPTFIKNQLVGMTAPMNVYADIEYRDGPKCYGLVVRFERSLNFGPFGSLEELVEYRRRRFSGGRARDREP
ncbi:MAG: hypothetical protein IT426_17430 [Pirellulales bacterium]|nr:hypothetical protein [Pirellulales bacterium]